LLLRPVISTPNFVAFSESFPVTSCFLASRAAFILCFEY
jgi:hypothetical protein